MIINHKIQGKRLYLRSLKGSDASEDYITWLNDTCVNRFLETRFQDQNLKSIITFIDDKNNSADEYLLGIFKNKGNHIGNIKIGPIRLYHSLAEVSIFIGDRSVWGKGYASESIAMITDFSSKHLKLRKLTASMYEDNIGSIRAFSKVGWNIEANLPNHYIADGQETNIVMMGLRL